MIRRVPKDLEPDEAPWFAAGASAANCPDPDLLQAALEGTTPEPVSDRLRAHAAECRSCSALAEVLRGEAVPQLSAEADQRLRRRLEPTARLPRPWLAGAAAAVLVGVASLTLWQRSGPGASAPGPAVPVAADPRTGQVSAPYALPLERPAIDLPPTALTLRGGRPDAYAAAIQEALVPFSQGEDAAAAEVLARVTRRYPGRPHASFYLGVARLLTGRPSDATAPLGEARRTAGQDRWLRDEAIWYLAVATERTSGTSAAAALLEPLCASSSGSRREAACAGLRRLSARGSQAPPVPAR